MNDVMQSDTRLRQFTLGGLVVSMLSLATMHAGYFFGDTGVDGIDVFFLASFALAWGFLVVVLFFTGKKYKISRFWKIDAPLYRIVVILFTIAAFSLNRSLEALGTTPFWLGAYLYLAFLGMFLDSFSERLPLVLNAVNSFFSGAGLVISLYFFILVAPLLPLSVVALVVFGISSVAFTPFFALMGFAQVWIKRKEKASRYSYAAGVVVPILFLFGFMAQYKVVRTDMVEVLKQHKESGSDLPQAIFAAQFLPQRSMGRQLMQVNDDKRLFDMELMWDGVQPNQNNDPLTVMGHGLSQPMPLNLLQRQEILSTQTDLRHDSQRRLWDDDHLLTRYVDTEVEIYPEYRLAYTEKTFEIEHYGKESGNSRWQEEAVYTFHLPEGSVATSLSLWVDGKERKARFSSKKQADEAYEVIVGRESRDPALLHWQEGNTLVVTVFPVMPELPRKFKLGVTSPLRLQNGQMSLENIYFEGPTHQFAREKGHLRVIGNAEEMKVPGYFEPANSREWTWEGSYESAWEISCPAGPVSNLPFTFNGHSYRAFAFEPRLEARKFDRIYLDLNQSWTDEEFEAVWQQAKGREVWAFDRGMKKVTESNRKTILDSARQARFSLFPFYLLENPAHSLVVSKSAPNYVNRADLADSDFDRRMDAFLRRHPEPIAFYQLGGEPGPYLRTLREFGALNSINGSPELLGAWLKLAQYPQPNLDSGKVVLPGAGLVIEQSDAEDMSESKAPDHLLRLFAYNKSLEEAGRNFLLDSEFSEEALRRAEEGYVVSPFTSLIVLETDADYERFGIEESENSLGNAGLSGMAGKGTGSVPEPHEWLLIGLVLLLLLYTQRRRFIRLA